MSKYRVELTPKNQGALERSAQKSGRTMVKELNHILEGHFYIEKLKEPDAFEKYRKAIISTGIPFTKP